jgi:hypothetical protein
VFAGEVQRFRFGNLLLSRKFWDLLSDLLFPKALFDLSVLLIYARATSLRF